MDAVPADVQGALIDLYPARDSGGFCRAAPGGVAGGAECRNCRRSGQPAPPRGVEEAAVVLIAAVTEGALLEQRKGPTAQNCSS